MDGVAPTQTKSVIIWVERHLDKLNVQVSVVLWVERRRDKLHLLVSVVMCMERHSDIPDEQMSGGVDGEAPRKT